MCSNYADSLIDMAQNSKPKHTCSQDVRQGTTAYIYFDNDEDLTKAFESKDQLYFQSKPVYFSPIKHKTCYAYEHSNYEVKQRREHPLHYKIIRELYPSHLKNWDETTNIKK